MQYITSVITLANYHVGELFKGMKLSNKRLVISLINLIDIFICNMLLQIVDQGFITIKIDLTIIQEASDLIYLYC